MTKYLIFDFDGTIADTLMSIVCTTQMTLQELGLPVVSADVIKKGIGLPLKGSLTRAGVPAEKLDEAADCYRSTFERVAYDKAVLFPGIKETLTELKSRGHVMAIATSRGRGSLLKLIDVLGLNGLFEVLVCVDDVTDPKPAPETVLKAMEQLGIQSSEAIVIGDTAFDIMMGTAAGCRTCGVTYGNHTREQLQEANPNWILDDFRGLLEITE